MYLEGKPSYQSEWEKLCDPSFSQLDRSIVIPPKPRETARKSLNKKEKEEFECRMKFPAIFIPSTLPADAAFMASQAVYHNLGGTRLLGASGWYGPDLVIAGKKAVEGSLFSVGFANTDTLASWKSFAKAFQEKWGSAPDPYKVASLSFDAVRILVAAGEAGSDNPQALRRHTFEGVYGPVRFDESGTNARTSIYSVEEGKFVNKTSCPSSEP
jgi:ABC-type branched-subunit amino acid transport system substrate-binding protein